MIRVLTQRIKSWWLHRQITAGTAVHGRVPPKPIKISLWKRIKIAVRQFKQTLGNRYED